LKRISKLRKAEIQQVVQDAGLEITGKETIGQMLLALRKHLKETMPVEHDELVEHCAKLAALRALITVQFTYFL
jgi:hypothetical protein